jgi:hypothetical protein
MLEDDLHNNQNAIGSEPQRGKAMYLRKGRVVLVGVFIFLVLVMSVTAGDISGKWIAPSPYENDVIFVFNVVGATFTGTLSAHPKDAAQIMDGKIKGDKITFYVERMIHQKRTKVRFKGTVIGDQINLTRDTNGALLDMTAKRERPNSSTAI